MKVNYQFITKDKPYYQEAIALRIALFFKDMPNALELINDERENQSVFLIAVEKDILVGVGRLTIDVEKGEGIISQMAIHPKVQGEGIGKGILDILKNTCKELQLLSIVLSARKTAVAFYENFGFEQEGELYASKKTGIIHQNMCLRLLKK